MKVDCVDFSACRILALEVEAVTKDCEGGNGLRCLTGTVLLQRVAVHSCWPNYVLQMQWEFAFQVKELLSYRGMDFSLPCVVI